MSAKHLLSEFDRVLEAPQAVPRLRRAVIEFALRGRLVEQNEADEPAWKLLQRIKAEKERVARPVSGTDKRGVISEIESGPFRLPATWSWTRLGEIAFGFRYGTSVKCSYEGPGEPVLRIPNIVNGRVDTSDLKFGSLPSGESAKLRLQEGDILVVRSNGSLDLVGRCAVVEPHAFGHCYAGYLVRIRTSPALVNAKFLSLSFTSRLTRDQIEGPIRTTVGLKNVNSAELAGLVLPMPPFAEQERIVAKVDELMALCDELGEAQTTRERRRDRLATSVQRHLVEASNDGAAFGSSATFLLQRTHRLLTKDEHIAELRGTILDLAVRGQLVPQDPHDESVDELLMRIQESRPAGRGVGVLRSSAPAVGPFSIPLSWRWVRLGEAFVYDAGNKRNPQNLDSSAWVLDLEDIERDSGVVINRATLGERYSKSTKSEFKVGDVLYGKLRPYLNKVTVAEEPGYSTTEIVAIRPLAGMSSYYCALALRSPYIVTYVTDKGRGTKMPRLRKDDALNALFPIPPVQEQERIVSRVDELMTICDALEDRLREGSSNRSRLLEAVLHETLRTAPQVGGGSAD